MTDTSIAAEVWTAGAILDAQTEHFRTVAAACAESYAHAAQVLGQVVELAAATRSTSQEAMALLNQAAAEHGLPPVCPPVDIVAVFDDAVRATGMPVPSWLMFSALVTIAEEATRG